MIKDEESRKNEWQSFIEKLNTVNIPNDVKDRVKEQVLAENAQYLRSRRQRLSAHDFEPIRVIGQGAFGEVRLCREKKSKQLLAIKRMKKEQLINSNQIANTRSERDYLSGQHNEWAVNLICSFQDSEYLYLCMEYIPGGDLMSRLMTVDTLSEKDARFYLAEIVLALDAVHQQGYMYRDLKPDNILLDKNGHIRLTDFGLCKVSDPVFKRLPEKNKQANYPTPAQAIQVLRSHTRKHLHSKAGTPDYMAPEVLLQKQYNYMIDYWSLGTIAFEMFFGFPPFFCDDPTLIVSRIINWQRTFVIPDSVNISPEARDFLHQLINDDSVRLGVKGIDQIKKHSFFQEIDWNRMKEYTPPYIPSLSSDEDTSHFDEFVEIEPWIKPITTKRQKQEANFIGYTWKAQTRHVNSQLLRALLDTDILGEDALKQLNTRKWRCNRFFNLQEHSLDIHDSLESVQSEMEERSQQGARTLLPRKQGLPKDSVKNGCGTIISRHNVGTRVPLKETQKPQKSALKVQPYAIDQNKESMKRIDKPFKAFLKTNTRH